jgi:hypothetical protein
MLSLPELQSRFFSSIARAPGLGPRGFDPTLIQHVEARGQLSAKERVDIYAEMYFARLLEVLEGDFPKVAALLDCERFHDVVSAYLALHPSTSPSLRHLGQHFPAFLRDREFSTDFPFLSDLALLEWARLDVFDAPDAEPLRIEQLQHLTPDAWPTLRFYIIPAFRIVQSSWPVHEFWKNMEEKNVIPTNLSPRETVLRVWRRDFLVYHTAMDPIEQAALTAVGAGDPFASVCATLAASLSEEEAASAIGSLLLRWIEDGILACVPSEPSQ